MMKTPYASARPPPPLTPPAPECPPGLTCDEWRVGRVVCGPLPRHDGAQQLHGELKEHQEGEGLLGHALGGQGWAAGQEGGFRGGTQRAPGRRGPPWPRPGGGGWIGRGVGVWVAPPWRGQGRGRIWMRSGPHDLRLTTTRCLHLKDCFLKGTGDTSEAPKMGRFCCVLRSIWAV